MFLRKKDPYLSFSLRFRVREQLKLKLPEVLRAVEAWAPFFQEGLRKVASRKAALECVQADGREIASQNSHMPQNFVVSLMHPRIVLTQLPLINSPIEFPGAHPSVREAGGYQAPEGEKHGY